MCGNVGKNKIVHFKLDPTLHVAQLFLVYGISGSVGTKIRINISKYEKHFFLVRTQL